MRRAVDFSRISLKDALDFAVLVEEEAKERYEEFRDQMELHRTPEAAEFFGQMAQNEEKHRAELLHRRRELFGDSETSVARSMLWDVEAPEYDQARAFMSPRQAMQVALESEIKAHEFFMGALEHITEGEVRRLFEELRDEEKVHQDLVRKEMAKLPPDSGVDPEAFVDGPVGL
jgi:erythrin-vacuolar iron transport family protein